MLKESTAEVKVRYAETDQMGVVYHANYLVWLEIGRESFLAQVLKKDYLDLERVNIISPVTSLQVKYIKSAVYGDVVTIKTSVKKFSPIRVTYYYKLFNKNDELLLTAETELVCVHKETFKVINMKKELPSWYSEYFKYMEEFHAEN